MKKKRMLIFSIITILFIASISSIIILKNSNTNIKLNKNNNLKEDEKNNILKDGETEIMEQKNENSDISNSEEKNANNNSNIYTETKKPNSSSNNNNTTQISPNQNDKQNNSSSTQNSEESKNETTPSTKKEIVDAIKKYDCGDTFTLSGNKCIYLLSSDALIRYTCSEGTLNGTKCNTTSTVELTYTSSLAKELCSSYSGSGYYSSCVCEKDGGTYNTLNKKCYKTVEIQKDANVEYYCTGGTTLNGTKCQKYYETDAPYTLTCPNGYTLNGNYCEK